MSINWYKEAMGLPSADYKNIDVLKETALGDMGMTHVNRWLHQEDADQIEQEHGPLGFEGQGGCGVAYSTPAGTIVKITTDLAEITAAKRVMALQAQKGDLLKHIVGVYSVKELGNGAVASLELEKARPLTKDEEWTYMPLFILMIGQDRVEKKIPIKEKDLRVAIPPNKLPLMAAVNELILWERSDLFYSTEMASSNMGWVTRDGKEVLAVIDVGAVNVS